MFKFSSRESSPKKEDLMGKIAKNVSRIATGTLVAGTAFHIGSKLSEHQDFSPAKMQAERQKQVQKMEGEASSSKEFKKNVEMPKEKTPIPIIESLDQLFEKLDQYFTDQDIKLGVGISCVGNNSIGLETIYNVIKNYFKKRGIPIYQDGTYPPEAEKKGEWFDIVINPRSIIIYHTYDNKQKHEMLEWK